MTAVLNVRLVGDGEAGGGEPGPATVTAVPFVAESRAAHGTVTAPAALQVIATIPAGSLPAGMYRIDAQSVFGGGAPAAPEDLNIEVRKATTPLKRIVSPRALHVPVYVSVQAELSGSQAINVVAIAIATASVVYNVSVTATRIA